MYNAIIGIAENIITGIKNLFITLFVPSDDFISEKLKPLQDFEDSIFQYSNLLRQFSDILEDTMKENVNGPPDFTIELWGAKCVVVNWDIVRPYRPLIHSLVIVIVYGKFLMWLMDKIACIIHTG